MFCSIICNFAVCFAAKLLTLGIMKTSFPSALA